MISVEHLCRRFGRVRAVDDVSFRVARGEILGVLGPNGAGKTTIMRILAGFLPATEGRVLVDGLDVSRDSIAVRQRLGYLPESAPLYPDMRTIEYLRFRGRLRGLTGRRLSAAIDASIESCGLTEARRALIGRLSKGVRQRVGLADSLLHRPPVLILDEPTIGLDPNQIRQIRGLIKGLGGRHTILLSSHILSEVESLCDRALILTRGRVVASGTPGDLVALTGDVTTSAVIQGPASDVLDALRQISGVRSAVAVETNGEWTRYVCATQTPDDVGECIFSLACRNGWRLRELKTERRTLEDAFAAITRERSGGSDPAPAKGGAA